MDRKRSGLYDPVPRGPTSAYAAVLSHLTEIVSPIWEMFQWGNVLNWKFAVGFLVALIALMVYAASRGPWLRIWLQAIGIGS